MNSTFRCCGKWVGNRAIKANSAREPFALLLPVPFLSGPPLPTPSPLSNYKRFVSAKIIFLFSAFISRSSISRAADDFISANVCPLARAVTWAESPHYTLHTHTHIHRHILCMCVCLLLLFLVWPWSLAGACSACFSGCAFNVRSVSGAFVAFARFIWHKEQK